MSDWLFDLGNSRLKFCAWRPGLQFGDMQAAAHASESEMGALPDEVAGWLAQMKEAGIGLTIVSNGAEKRVRPFAKKLGLAYLYRSAKPLPFALMVARRRMGVKRKQMAMVGDQLYADRMAAALYGIPGLMVIPRGPDLGAQVVLKRKWEKRHWQKYYDRGGKTL